MTDIHKRGFRKFFPGAAVRFAIYAFGLFLFCGLASLVFINYIFPRLATVPGLKIFTPRFTALVSQTQRIEINDGINTGEVYEKIRSVSVMVASYSSFASPVNLAAPDNVGGGAIATADGLVFASKRTVGSPKNIVKIVLSDGRVFDAAILTFDLRSELAVLKINADNLPFIRFGNSKSIRSGDKLVAVGPTWGSIDHPLVSARLERQHDAMRVFPDIRSSEEVAEFLRIQPQLTDDYEGVMLANGEAEVIGMQTVAGILPSEYLRQALDLFLKRSSVMRGRLGINYAPLSPAASRLANLPVAYGAWLKGVPGQTAVLPNSAAAAAGLLAGDIIVRVGGTDVSAAESFESLIGAYAPGETVEITYYRGEEVKISRITLK